MALYKWHMRHAPCHLEPPEQHQVQQGRQGKLVLPSICPHLPYDAITTAIGQDVFHALCEGQCLGCSKNSKQTVKSWSACQGSWESPQDSKLHKLYYNGANQSLAVSYPKKSQIPTASALPPHHRAHTPQNPGGFPKRWVYQHSCTCRVRIGGECEFAGGHPLEHLICMEGAQTLPISRHSIHKP